MTDSRQTAKSTASTSEPLPNPFGILFLLNAAFALGVIASAYLNRDDIQRVPMVPMLIAAGIPCFGTCVLLVTGRPRLTACGAGIAAGLAITAVLVLPLPVLFLTVGDGANDRAAVKALSTMLLLSIALAYSTLRRWSGGGLPFFGSLVAAVMYSVTALFYVPNMTELGKPSGKDLVVIWLKSNEAMRSLTACLIQNEALNPEAGFPPSLDAIPPDWGCDASVVKPGAIREYVLSYTRIADSANNGLPDFHLTAMPVRKGLNSVDPMRSDRRGALFVYYGWFVPRSRTLAELEIRSSDLRNSNLTSLANDIKEWMTRHGNLALPSLAPLGDNGMRLPQRAYLITYHPPRSVWPGQFALSATCQAYGQQCIRSYFLDYDGTIHATAEPRRATANDPLALSCESTSDPCTDAIDWPMP